MFQAEVIEQEITDLRQACDSMAEEVTKLTKGTGKFILYYLLSAPRLIPVDS